MLDFDDYAVVLTYRATGIEMKNTFWFKTSSGSSSLRVAESFDANLLPFIRAVLATAVSFESTYAYSLVNPADFHTNVHTVTNGLRTGGIMPMFNGWAFQYLRPTRQINHGRKNFGGISETDVQDGIATPSANTVLLALAVELSSVHVVDGPTVMAPCIAQTTEYVNPDNGKTYRIPETLWIAQGVQYKRVSTQNTRKR